MPDQVTIDELLEQEPYISDTSDVTADVDLTEALRLTAEEVVALSDEERQEQAEDWVHERAGEDLLDIQWDIVDPRFTHATAVVDFVIDEVILDGVGDQWVGVVVELHETHDGYHERLGAEATALGRDDVVARLETAATERQALESLLREHPTQYVQQVCDRALELHRQEIQAIPATHDYDAWHDAMCEAATKVAEHLELQHGRVADWRFLWARLRTTDLVWKVELHPHMHLEGAEVEARLFPEGAPREAYEALRA